MPILIKSIYGFETDPKKTPFGLLNHQMRGDSVLNNAGWFNFNGERLGSGDLSLADLTNIAKSLPKGEAFIALTEIDSSLALPSNLDRTNPGRAYVLENAVWVVAMTIETGINVVIRIKNSPSVKMNAVQDGAYRYIVISRAEFHKSVNYVSAKSKINSVEQKQEKSTTIKKSSVSSSSSSNKISSNKILNSLGIPSPAAKPSATPAPVKKIIKRKVSTSKTSP